MMTDWTKVAFILPGQGSQQIGMGKDFADTFDIARDTFQQADDIMEFGLTEYLFKGPEEMLDRTDITQPAMYVNSIAIWRVLIDQLPDAKPSFVAGHSLGELTALTVANALTFEDGLKLVKERGRLMHEAGEKMSGGMAAILGLSNEQVEAICKQASEQIGEQVVLANDNCPGQIVISGNQEALNVAIELAKEAGAKRAIPLHVSTAPHSPVMKPAEADFIRVVESTTFNEPVVPVYANISAEVLHGIEAIQKELEAQLTSPVHWTSIIQHMIRDGAETFVEIGSKNVLSGLVRRIDRSVTRENIDTVDALNAFIEKYG